MTEKEIQDILDELNDVRPEVLNDKAKRLFEAIMKIANERDELRRKNEELEADNLEYQRIQDLSDKRTYRKKYLEERRKEEPNLLYPDSDEIYQRYYELKEQLANSIPVQKVKDKIKELEKKIEAEYNEKVIIQLHKQKKILQELLEGSNK